MPDAVSEVAVSAESEPWRKAHGEEQETLLSWYRTQDDEWNKLSFPLADCAQGPKGVAKKQAMICSEGLPPIRLHSQGGDYLEQTHFLKRGDPNQKEGIATQGFLAGADAFRRRARNAGRLVRRAGWAHLLPPALPGELDHRHRSRSRSPSGARDRQSTLAAPFRQGHRRHHERFRRTGRSADSSRIARLAGLGIDRPGLASEAHPSIDRHQLGLPSVIDDSTPKREGSTRPIAWCGGASRAGWKRR